MKASHAHFPMLLPSDALKNFSETVRQPPASCQQVGVYWLAALLSRSELEARSRYLRSGSGNVRIAYSARICLNCNSWSTAATAKPVAAAQFSLAQGSRMEGMLSGQCAWIIKEFCQGAESLQQPHPVGRYSWLTRLSCVLWG